MTLFFSLSATGATDGFDFATELLPGIMTVLSVERSTPDHVKRKEDGKKESVNGHSRYSPENEARKDEGGMAESAVQLLQLS